MTTYYKATRQDGMSFYDEATRWQVGRITRVEGSGMKLCGPGVLHASTEKGETLIGGEWPCRLFEVEPRSRVITGAFYKVGAHAWKVVRELPAHEALGPNGLAVAHHLEQCRTLTGDQAAALNAARRERAWNAALNAAWENRAP